MSVRQPENQISHSGYLHNVLGPHRSNWQFLAICLQELRCVCPTTLWLAIRIILDMVLAAAFPTSEEPYIMWTYMAHPGSKWLFREYYLPPQSVYLFFFFLSLLVQKLYTLGCPMKNRGNFYISVQVFSAGNLPFCEVAKLVMETGPRKFWGI